MTDFVCVLDAVVFALHDEQLAAAYIWGIVKNHGFSDGNKRTALVTADVFLMLNGYQLSSAPADDVTTILAVANGTLTEDDLMAWVRRNIAAF